MKSTVDPKDWKLADTFLVPVIAYEEPSPDEVLNDNTMQLTNDFEKK